jgi:hypothetical protein
MLKTLRESDNSMPRSPHYFRNLTLWSVALSAILIAQKSVDPEQQLEAALHLEIVLGDLSGSMDQYRAILAHAGPGPVAARALLQIGLCQEKLGQRKEAYDTYRRVAAEYGDQTGIVQQARAKLTAWSGPKNLKFDEGVPGKVPPGWFVPSFPKDADYLAELHRDKNCRSRTGCAVVVVPGNVPKAVGYLMQNFSAAAYTGKTVRLRAWIKLESFFTAPMPVGLRLPNPEDRAQMFLNVERSNRRHGFSDSMDDRPVRSTDWTQVEIVAEIDSDAQFINFGVMSIGGGRVWVDDVSFEVTSPH